MNLIAALITPLVILSSMEVLGIEWSTFIPRQDCFPNTQKKHKKKGRCKKDFIEVYPQLSKSTSNQTEADTWFFLFTRKNPDEPERLHKCGGDLPPKSNFNPNNRLIVILIPFIAGYCDIAAYREWTVQILIREDANVMVVDWTWGNRPDYALANRNAKIVAAQTTIVLQNIQKRTGITKDQIYLVGQSLGAQIGGMIGNKFPVGRITGLDPAGPGFAKEETPPEDRLDRDDADLVDVWHTNMGDCLPFFGINYDAGDVDYYINGGIVQPPCYPYAFISILKRDYLYGFGTLLIPTTCFHAQSAQYFKVSINPGNCQFVGVKCIRCQMFKLGVTRSCGKNGENCMIMGYDLDKYFNATEDAQKYFVETTLFCPYCDNSNIRLQGFKDTYIESLQTSEK